MEPSIFRINQEFKNDSNMLYELQKYKQHTYEEFPFLGDLYYRDTIDSHFKYSKIIVPNNIREKSINEPRYFK
jgi:hypothetical protein